MQAKPGSFTPYLEYANSSASSRSSDVAANAPTPLAILEILARQVQRSLPIWDLQSLSGMDPSRFRDELRRLLGLGYVAVDGGSLEEVIRLTDKGAEAASLAR